MEGRENIGKCMCAQVQPTGDCNVVAGIRVAQLALKHRMNKASKMRIVIFVGSPIENANESEVCRRCYKRSI